MEKTILDQTAMLRTMKRIAHEIIERNQGVDNIVVFGIKTRGVYLAKQIAQFIEAFEGKPVLYADLDISPYRDDVKSELTADEVNKIGFDIEGKDIVLVDDVLFTGRTVRAAMDAIMDIGRAKTIQLAILVDRGHRELPVRPDYIGKNIPTSKTERVQVKIAQLDGENAVVILK
jgi:pyrimidine operon attenuation protein/uracil phosphoribosyltransferase